MSTFYNRDGEVIDVLEWSKLFNDPAYRRVDMTPITDDMHVSTVWVGFNHSPLPDGETMIFETAVFSGGEPIDRFRSASLEGAQIIHEAVVAELSEKADDAGTD